MKRGLWYGLLVCVFICLACAYGKGAPYAEKGRLFPWKKMQSVEKGMLGNNVRQLLGEPLEIKKEGELERWRYYVRERQDEHIRFLGFIPTRKAMNIGTAEAIIELRAGVVERVNFKFVDNLDR